jgi:hypothetical protein
MHPSKLHSAKQQTDILKRKFSLPQSSTTAAKYAAVVRALSLPSTHSSSNSPVPTNPPIVQFEIEYHRDLRFEKQVPVQFFFQIYNVFALLA